VRRTKAVTELKVQPLRPKKNNERSARKKKFLSFSTCVSDVSPRGAHSDLHALNLPFWGALANSPFQRQCECDDDHAVLLPARGGDARRLGEGEAAHRRRNTRRRARMAQHDGREARQQSDVRFQTLKKRGSCQHSSIFPPNSEQLWVSKSFKLRFSLCLIILEFPTKIIIGHRLLRQPFHQHSPVPVIRIQGSKNWIQKRLQNYHTIAAIHETKKIHILWVQESVPAERRQRGTLKKHDTGVIIISDNLIFK